MRKDIELMKRHGADGLVLGALTEDGRVDAELCMEFLGKVLQCSMREETQQRPGNRAERHLSHKLSEKHSFMSYLILYVCFYKWK